MGIAHAQRGRLTAALIVTVLAALAVVAVLALAGPASAKSSWTHGSAVLCGSCHSGSPAGAANATIACSTCHTGYVASLAGTSPANCTTCHTPGQNMATAKTNAATGGCGNASAGANCHNNTGHAGSTPTTCVNCHGVTASATDAGQSAHHETAVTDVTVKALLTIKASATKITLGKTVKLSGLAKSVQAGYVVKVAVQKKNTSGVFKPVTTKTAVWTQATASWTLTYKPAKKGVYRFKASTPLVPGTNGNAVAIPAKATGYKTLTVK
jgi:hypothetical protein